MKTFVKIPTLIFISIILITYIFLNDKAMLNYKEDVIFQNQLIDSTKGKPNYGKNGLISEYMRFYQLNPVTHYSCQLDVIRPSPDDVTWRKDTYQQFKLQFKEYPENDVFVMKFYFDDRFMPATGERHIRAFVTVHGPGHLKNAKESKPVAEWLGSMRGSPWYVLYILSIGCSKHALSFVFLLFLLGGRGLLTHPYYTNIQESQLFSTHK